MQIKYVFSFVLLVSVLVSLNGCGKKSSEENKTDLTEVFNQRPPHPKTLFTETQPSESALPTPETQPDTQNTPVVSTPSSQEVDKLTLISTNNSAKDVKKSEDEEFAKRLAKQSVIEENYLKAMRYHEGIGVPKDPAKALEYFTIAANGNHAEALFNLGVYYVTGLAGETNLTKAIECFKRSAEQNHPDALFNLAVHYTKGIGVDVDLEKASEYTKKASDLGQPEAEYNLAVMYATGTGVAKDQEAAAQHFLNVAEQGFPSAQANIGVYYLEGIGIKQDVKEAEKWLIKAAEQGNVSAQFNLGVFYAKGRNGKTNLVEAFKWSALAAEQGDEVAASNRDLLVSDMTPKQIADATRATSEFVFTKIKKLQSEGIIKINPIDPERLKKIEGPQLPDKAILPTENRPILNELGEDMTNTKTNK